MPRKNLPGVALDFDGNRCRRVNCGQLPVALITVFALERDGTGEVQACTMGSSYPVCLKHLVECMLPGVVAN